VVPGRALFIVAVVPLALGLGAVAWPHANPSGQGSDSHATEPVEPSALAGPSPAAAAVVTMTEREAAEAAMVACLAESGFEVYGVRLPGEGFRLTKYSVGYPDADGVPDDDNARRANEIMGECRAKHTSAVNAAWNAQHPGPAPAQLEDVIRQLEVCMAGGGVPRLAGIGTGLGNYPDLPRYPLAPRTDEGFRLYAQCALQVEADTGFLAPYPWPDFTEWLLAHMAGQPAGAP
jgi:hypothetical protein